MKQILTFDFDGVLHSYTSGWLGAHIIPDPPVAGAIEFLRKAIEHFRVAICSSRCVLETQGHLRIAEVAVFVKDERGITEEVEVGHVKVVSSQINALGVSAMTRWLMEWGLSLREVSQIEFWACKPPSHVMIDDRAIQFNGDWGPIEEITIFKPWNHHLRHG